MDYNLPLQPLSYHVLAFTGRSGRGLPHPLNLPHLPPPDPFACIPSVRNALFPQNHKASGIHLNDTFLMGPHLCTPSVSDTGIPHPRFSGFLLFPGFSATSAAPVATIAPDPVGIPTNVTWTQPSSPSPQAHTRCLLPHISGLRYLCKVADATGPTRCPHPCSPELQKLMPRQDTGAHSKFFSLPHFRQNALRHNCSDGLSEVSPGRCRDPLHLTPNGDSHGMHSCIDSPPFPASPLLSLALTSLEFCHQ